MLYLKTVFIVLIIYLLLVNNELFAQTMVDSLCIKPDKMSSDSLRVKPSKAPIIAFGIVGALSGGVIGGSIDPPKKGIEGEMSFSVSKTGLAGFILGGICGSYIGYLLAKRQVEKNKVHQ